MIAATGISVAPEEYSLTNENASEISSTMSAFEAAVSAAAAAEYAYRTAVVAKNNARATAVATFNRYMKQSYATATVQDTAFTAIGLDARGPGPTPRSVVQPMELWATPFANGRVQLKWNRNGNTYATVFVIEAKVADNEWDIVGTTTQSKITLEGYEPGVTTSFRIIAKKGKQTAAPSNISLIYPPGGTAKRSIAA